MRVHMTDLARIHAIVCGISCGGRAHQGTDDKGYVAYVSYVRDIVRRQPLGALVAPFACGNGSSEGML